MLIENLDDILECLFMIEADLENYDHNPELEIYHRK